MGRAAACITFLATAAAAVSGCTLPNLITFDFKAHPAVDISYSFTPTSSVNLTGLVADECGKGSVSEASVPDGKLALLVGKYSSKGCFTSSAYMNTEYQVDSGSMTLGDGTSFAAYRVHPPRTKASSFVAADMLVYIKLESGDTVHTLSTAVNGVQVRRIPPPGPDANKLAQGKTLVSLDGFNNTGQKIHNLEEPVTFFVTPAGYSFPVPTTAYLGNGEATECRASISDEARTFDGFFSIVNSNNNAGPVSNFQCFGPPSYMHQQYQVDTGEVTVSNGPSYPAYLVHPHAISATRYVAGHQLIFLKVEPGQTVFTVAPDGNGGQVLTEHLKGSWLADRLAENKTLPDLDGLTNTGIDVAKYTEPTAVFVAPSGTRMSKWNALSSTVQGACLANSSLGYSLQMRQFAVPGIPIDLAKAQRAKHTGVAGVAYTPKVFFPVSRSDGKEGVLWRDAKDPEYKCPNVPQCGDMESNMLYMTWFEEDLKSADTRLVYTLAGI